MRVDLDLGLVLIMFQTLTLCRELDLDKITGSDRTNASAIRSAEEIISSTFFKNTKFDTVSVGSNQFSYLCWLTKIQENLTKFKVATSDFFLKPLSKTVTFLRKKIRTMMIN